MSIRFTHPTLQAFQNRPSTFDKGLEGWYDIYLTILPKIDEASLTQEIHRAISKPIFIQKSDKQNLFLNNFMLLMAITSQYPLSQTQLNRPLTLFILENETLDIGVIFYETIELIGRQKKALNNKDLKLKDLKESISKLLTQQQCQSLFNEKKLTIDQFALLIQTAKATIHLPKDKGLGDVDNGR